MHIPTSASFKQNAHEALRDAGLQKALARSGSSFIARRAAAVAALPEFETLRDTARDIKNHTIAHLDFYLEAFATKVEAAGGHVHWCSTADEARAAVLDICRDANARTVTKGKSMIGEELSINDHLEKHGIQPVETDLGEYIIQLRHEMPSHIIAPAFHLNREDWEATFRASHTDMPADRVFAERRDILTEARSHLRAKFLAADVGITGANFLVAETGSSVIVTNEGNGDLTQTLPRVHIALASIEKVVPTLEDCVSLLRVLARSATGQDFSVYTTFSTGARRPGDLDGPEQYHVVIVDNGRSAMIGTEFQDMLRCIRCAACMNHCPVYGAVGGHAYGWVYPGSDGQRPHPRPHRRRSIQPAPRRLHLLRQMRERLPGPYPAPRPDAPLARARVRAPPQSPGRAPQHRSLGLVRPPPVALSLGHPRRRAGSRHARPPPRPLHPHAHGQRMDRRARHACAGRRHVLRPLRPHRTRRPPPMSRESVLQSIRRGLRRGPLPQDLQDTLRRRMATHPRHLIPARSRLPHAGQVALFIANLEKEYGTVTRVADPNQVPGAVADYLAAQNLPSEFVMAPHPELQSIQWSARPLLRIREGRAEATDLVSVQHGFAGIAETGTLMLPSAPTRPTTINLLADTEIVVLRDTAHRRRLRRSLGPAARRNGRHAAQRHARDRPVALRRHRADAGARRARPPPASHVLVG